MSKSSGPVFYFHNFLHGWECLDPDPADWRDGEFEDQLREFLLAGESVLGAEMIRRAREQGTASGLFHAQAMLSFPCFILPEWQGRNLVLPQRWKDPDGNEVVWSLLFQGEHWALGSSLLDNLFDSRNCFLHAAHRI